MFYLNFRTHLNKKIQLKTQYETQQKIIIPSQ